MWMIEAPPAWHRQGLFMGMHWLWWLIWLLTIAIVAWAFWRLHADREARRIEERRRETAEEILRRRLAEGTVGEEEFLHRMHLLRDSRSVPPERTARG